MVRVDQRRPDQQHGDDAEQPGDRDPASPLDQRKVECEQRLIAGHEREQQQDRHHGGNPVAIAAFKNQHDPGSPQHQGDRNSEQREARGLEAQRPLPIRDRRPVALPPFVDRCRHDNRHGKRRHDEDLRDLSGRSEHGRRALAVLTVQHPDGHELKELPQHGTHGQPEPEAHAGARSGRTGLASVRHDLALPQSPNAGDSEGHTGHNERNTVGRQDRRRARMPIHHRRYRQPGEDGRTATFHERQRHEQPRSAQQAKHQLIERQRKDRQARPTTKCDQLRPGRSDRVDVGAALEDALGQPGRPRDDHDAHHAGGNQGQRDRASDERPEAVAPLEGGDVPGHGLVQAEPGQRDDNIDEHQGEPEAAKLDRGQEPGEQNIPNQPQKSPDRVGRNVEPQRAGQRARAKEAGGRGRVHGRMTPGNSNRGR